jgi:crotonobetainyl-CoA:carnitine CoA-transferase CaiB-like acyl-CoA transferase
MYSALGIMAALRHRDANDGEGQHVDVSLLDVGVALMSGRASEFFLTGKQPAPAGSIPTGSAPAALFECADGILNVQASGDADFRRLCQVLGLMHLVDDPAFCSRPDRARNGAKLLALLRPEFLKWKVLDLYNKLVAAQVMCSPVNEVREVFEDPHIKARGLKIHRDHPLAEALPMIVNPIRFSETPISHYATPPMLGSDTAEILQQDFSMLPSEIAALKKKGVI